MIRTVKEFGFLSFFWFVTVCLLPLLIPLALYTRKTALRLPEAKGPLTGFIPKESQETIHLTIIGESTVVGVGVEHHRQGLATGIAFHLAEALNCNVHWRILGQNGIDIQGTIEQLVPQIPRDPIDYLVICLGVNDTTGMTSLRTWQKRITQLTEQLQETSPCILFFSGVPPMRKFTALPQPLRWVMGLRAAILDQGLNHHPLRGKAFQLIPFSALLDPEYLAIDGYHPSEAGYFAWGKNIAKVIVEYDRRNYGS